MQHSRLHVSRHVQLCGLALALVVVLGLVTLVPLLRLVGAFLVVEGELEPAAAIVVLGGTVPFRALAAADIYRAGWAPTVVLVSGGGREEDASLRAMGITVPREWEINREVLVRRGVPAAAIVVLDDDADGTLEELQAVTRALAGDDRPVILVTSRYHSRRVQSTWQYITRGGAPAIVRAAPEEPFDPDRWWAERRSVLAVVREYLGLLNLWSGFAVPARAARSAFTVRVA